MQNINIIYKVDSSQIDASNAKVKQASAATDQLTASAKKFSDQSARSQTQFSSTIEGTRLKIQQLRAQIDLTNQSDTARLNNLISQYKQQQAQLDKYQAKLKEVTQAQDSTAKSSGSLTGQITGLYNALKLVIGAAIVKQFISMSVEAAALSGKVEGVQKSFQRAFPNSVGILNDLRTATHGAVTDFELMQRSLQATNLGVSIEKLPILLEFAAARAQQTGESVDYLVDSIVRGIGRKSVLVLDNLGLSTTRLKEQFNGAAIASKSVAEVTEGVAKIAQEELNKMGGYVDNTKTKVDQLTVSWENLKIATSKLATQEGGFIDFLKGYVDAFKTLVEAKNAGLTVDKYIAQQNLKQAAQNGVNLIQQQFFTEDKKKNLEVTKEAIALKTHDLIQQQEEIKNLAEQLKTTKNYQEVVKNTQQQKDLKEANFILVEQIKLLQGVQKQLEQGIVPDKRDIDSLDALEQKLKDLNDQLKNVEPISTIQGINQAKILYKQIVDTENKIQIIKDKIFGVQKDFSGKPFIAVVDIEFKDPKTGEVASKSRQQFIDKFLNDLGIDLNKKPPIVPVQLDPPDPKYIDSFTDKLVAAFKDKGVQQAIKHSFNIAENQVASLEQLEVNSYDIRIKNLNDFYDQQVQLAGDNNKAKEQLQKDHDKKLAQLEKQRAEAAKKAALSTIIINTAIGVVKAFATSATIYDGIIEAAFVAAEGASQYAIASRQQYAQGVIDVKGPGTGTSDSIPAMISRGESVMTARETQDSGKTLRMIRAKKLNDKILDRIMQQSKSGGAVVGFDDTRLVNETRKVARAAAGNDLVRKGSIIYEAKEEGKNLKRYIRSKTLN